MTCACVISRKPNKLLKMILSNGTFQKSYLQHDNVFRVLSRTLEIEITKQVEGSCLSNR